MKKTVLLLWFGLSVMLLRSQDFTPNFIVSDRTTGYDLSIFQYAGNSTIGNFALGAFEGVNVIAKLDAKMSMENKYPVDRKIFKANVNSGCKLAAMGEHLWFLKLTPSLKAGKTVLCAYHVSLDSLRLSGMQMVSTPEKITVDDKGSVPPSYLFSADSKTLLIYYQLATRDTMKYYVKALDENMKMKWERVITTTMLKMEARIAKTEVDDAGTFYLLYYKTDYVKRKEKREFHLIVCKDNGTYFVDRTLDIADHDLYDASFDIAANGSVQIAGTYSTGLIDEISGTFEMYLEPYSYLQKTPMISPFSDDLIHEFGTVDNDSVRRMKARFSVTDVHATPDGGVTLLIEHAFSLTETVTNTSMDQVNIKDVTIQFHQEILAFHYSSNNLLWQDIIYKNQSTYSGHALHSSFLPFYSGNTTWLIYNDNVQDDENSYEYSSGEIQICKLDSAGKIFIHDLTPALPKETIFLRDYTTRVSDDTLLLYVCADFYLRRMQLKLD